MSLRRVLYAGPEGRTARIRPKVKELEITFVLLTKGYSGCAPPDRIDVELDRSVAERDAFEYRIAAVQSHQAVIKTQLPEEFSILFGLPVVSSHRNVDRFWALTDRRQEHATPDSNGEGSTQKKSAYLFNFQDDLQSHLSRDKTWRLGPLHLRSFGSQSEWDFSGHDTSQPYR